MSFELIEPNKRRGLLEEHKVVIAVYDGGNGYAMHIMLDIEFIKDQYGWIKGELIEILYDRSAKKILLRKGKNGHRLQEGKGMLKIARALNMGNHNNPLPEKRLTQTPCDYEANPEGLVIDLPDVK